MGNHGVNIYEKGTTISAPVRTVASAQCVFGVAPIYMLEDPDSVTNVPVLANSGTEAMEKLGFCTDFKLFTLCQTMYAVTNLYSVAPVVFVNVASMEKCATESKTLTLPAPVPSHWETEEKMARKNLVIKQGETTLTDEEDYVLSYNEKGNLCIDFIADSAFDVSKETKVTGKIFDASKVTASDVLGSIDVNGKPTGIELVRSVYPKFGVLPTILLAPGFSKNPAVGISLSAKAAKINGVFKAIAVLDLDTAQARSYTEVKTVKESSGFTSEFCWPIWLCAKVEEYILAGSTVAAALLSYTDAARNDIPSRSGSNLRAAITGTCLEDGKEVELDVEQATTVENFGVSTFTNMNGWRLWGNYTGAYPNTTDAKDMWVNIRRMFNWQSNQFILNYFDKVDDPMNMPLIESIVDSENIRCAAYVPEVWAGASIHFLQEDNPITDLLAGKITFRQQIAPYPPAREITNIISYDTQALRSALGLGGE